MLKKVKVGILQYIGHLIYPYVENEQKKRENNTLDWYKSQFKACGEEFIIGSSYMINGMKYISIGDNFYSGDHLRLEAIDQYAGVSFNPELTIGNNVMLQEYCHIGCIDSVSIGDGTLIASKVFITDHMHGSIIKDDFFCRPELRKLSHKPVVIGKNVWIGDGVCILPGVTLGDNVIVGANAVVTHSFSANTVIAGCPAKVIKVIE